MIIFGTKSTTKTLDTGTFQCPQCQGETDFRKRRSKGWFHLYFIPIIPLKTYPPYVECQTCSGTFVTEVLTTGGDSEQIRAEFELAALEILVQMAWADGQIDPEEINAIAMTINSINQRDFTIAEVEASVAAGENSTEDAFSIAKYVEPRLNDSGKELIMRSIYMVAAADGNIAEEEKDMILEVGAGLGLRPSFVKKLLESYIEASIKSGELT